MPQYCAFPLYEGWPSKKSRSDSSARLIFLFISMSLCPRLTTGTYPNLSGMTRPARMSTTSVPVSLHQCVRLSNGPGKGPNHAHEIYLSQDTYRPRSFRINFSRQLQPVRVCQILITRRDRQNDTTRLRNILQEHIPDLLLDILRLIANRHLGHTRQVDES